MAAQTSFSSSSFHRVAKGLVALHRLIKEGKDDSPEAEAIRDALDPPLRALNRVEKERAQWLSADLYSVSEPPALALEEMNPEAQQVLNEAIEAHNRGDWDKAFTLLRRLRESISPARLSYLRGSVWLEAGLPKIAAFFFEHACEKGPENANYKAIYISTLAAFDPEATGILAGPEQ